MNNDDGPTDYEADHHFGYEFEKIYFLRGMLIEWD